jgi:hypothetical protein
MTLFVGIAAQFVMAAILAYSSIQKAVPGGSISPVLAELGFRKSLTRPLAYSIAGAEGIAALLLVLWPLWTFTYLLILALAAAFMSTGALAIRQHKEIKCRCLGASSDSTLGWTQVAMGPAWLLGCILTYAWGRQFELETGTGLVAAIVLLIGVFRVVRVERLRRILRWDRFATAA